MSYSNLIDRLAEAAYLENIRSYAAMTPLNAELEALVIEPDWLGLEPSVRQHWRLIVRAILRAQQTVDA